MIWSALNGGFSLACSWALVRSGRIGQHPVVFLFGLVAGSFSIFSILHKFGWASLRTYVLLYWGVELFEQAFALALMLVVISRAVNGKRPAAILSQALASIFVIVVAALLCEGPMVYNSRWMTGFTRNLSFGVAILNFQVWGTVLGEKVKSREILLMAAGLGMLTTGKSLGHTIRLVSHPSGWLTAVGNNLVVLTSILASAALFYAVRTPRNQNRQAKEKRLKLVKAA